MTPAARLSAAIEVLDRIASTRQPADQALKAWGVHNRYAGSGDRRAIADRVYACLRGQGGQMTTGKGTGRRMVLASLGLPLPEIEALFSGQGHAPPPLTDEERAWLSDLSADPRLPAFIQAELQRAFGADWAEEAEALLRGRAPLGLRINTLKSDVQAVAEAVFEHGYPFEAARMSAVGLRVQPGADVQAFDLFEAGAFEIQDEGSQVAAWLVGAKPGETVVDYCAGGGGKTLALGQAMAGQGRLIASDLDPRRLDAIRPRLERAGVAADLRRLDRPGVMDDLAGQADRVLVDAPCSGSGTWRRRPEDAWRLTEAEIQRLHAVQRDVLDKAAMLVRPGGRLAYVTCSVLLAENGDVALEFAAAHPDFRPLPLAEAAKSDLLTDFARARLAELGAGGHTVQLSPRRTDTDGFFIALFERTL
jgi:16S rRNA (cytosine967-C5)-methyltransferase